VEAEQSEVMKDCCDGMEATEARVAEACVIAPCLGAENARPRSGVGRRTRSEVDPLLLDY